MQYNKAMIDLVNRLRRAAPPEEVHRVKLANPELMRDLIAIAGRGDDLFRSLVAQLCELAGPPWPSRFHGEEETPAEKPKKKRSMFYRGQEMPESAAEGTPQKSDSSGSKEKSKKIKRVYRGQVIYDD